MLQMRHTVIVLFIIVTFYNVNCASVVTQKEIEKTTLREFKIRDDISTDNSSLESRSRTERLIKEEIQTTSDLPVSFFSVFNKEEIEKKEPVIDFKTEQYNHNISYSSGDYVDGATTEKQPDKTETTGEDNKNDLDLGDFGLGNDDQDDDGQDNYQDDDRDSDQDSHQGNDEDNDQASDKDSDQENDGNEGEQNDEKELQAFSRHRHRHGQIRRKRYHRYRHRNYHRYRHRNYQRYRDRYYQRSLVIPEKSYLKLPTGVYRYIKNHNNLMRNFKCGSNSTLLDLKRSDYEYKLMANEMQSTIQSHSSLRFSKYDIRKIEKVVNGCLMRRYKRRQQQILSEYNHLNELVLFHGTYKVKELLTTGFDERYASIGGMFGAGMYFAEHSSKSNQYAFGHGGQCDKHKDRHCKICVRQMLICRVTLGNIYKVRHARTKISNPPPGYHSLEGVASNTTRGLKYNEYIVYRGEQAYPEYVITYKLKL